MDPLLEETRHLLTATLGQAGRATEKWEDVSQALQAGKTDIVLSLPWEHPGEAPQRHQIVLSRREGDRLVYYNPKGHAKLPVGATLPGNKTVPERRVEGTGLESLPEFVIRDLFIKGAGAALIPD
jgi:hypothetical protein